RSTGKFLDGARTIVEAMLQSPNFLFHREGGPDGKSTDYDVASRLSYLLWDTMPDKPLLDAAGRGELKAEAGRLREARRMLPNPPGEFSLVRFPADSRRAGLLGEASFLASTAGPTETSPTARGIFVREQLLCQHVPPPRPNVNTTLPEPSQAKPLTRRQRMSA